MWQLLAFKLISKKNALETTITETRVFITQNSFFDIIPEFIFTPIAEIKISEKKIRDIEKKSFSKTDFDRPI